VERLQAGGYAVTAPYLLLHSLTDNVARLREVLAHSYPAPAVVTFGEVEVFKPKGGT